MKIIIEIANNYPEWLKEKWLNKFLIKKISKNILQRFTALKNASAVEISILLTHNEQMKQLKRDFLGNLQVTNVLSFPDAITSTQQLLELPFHLDYIYLGDIALGYEIIKNEAAEQGKTFKDHFIHLLIHSILHLIGFDHKTDENADIMEGLEINILKHFKISSPY